MHIPEIIEVKDHLEKMKTDGLLESWELPYENILTRRSAAIFFITPKQGTPIEDVWKEINKYENFSQRPNTEKKLSELEYRITFSAEEKEKNENQSISKEMQ